MSHILVATDSDDVAEETFSALAAFGTTVSRVRKGQDVRPVVKAVSYTHLTLPTIYTV